MCNDRTVIAQLLGGEPPPKLVSGLSPTVGKDKSQLLQAHRTTDAQNGLLPVLLAKNNTPIKERKTQRVGMSAFPE